MTHFVPKKVEIKFCLYGWYLCFLHIILCWRFSLLILWIFQKGFHFEMNIYQGLEQSLFHHQCSLRMCRLSAVCSRDTHVVTNGRWCFFSRLTSIPLCVCVYTCTHIHMYTYSLSFHLLLGSYGCLRILAILNTSTIGTALMGLEHIMPSEVSEAEKGKDCKASLTGGV
jgi:hypothetical protein